jgi:hypothetical protein
MLQEQSVYHSQSNTKRVLPYGPEAFKVQVETRRKLIVAIFSSEDLEGILPLDIRSQFVNKKERLLIWAGRKSMALSRYILESFDPIENSEKFYVRHKNENNLDFRRENLCWSTSSSGKIRPKKRDNLNPRKVVLVWNGHRLLFNDQQEADEAHERLKNGEFVHNIFQTARKRKRPMTEVSGGSTSDWAIWLRQRQIELCEVKEWINNERKPYPFEDEYLRRILSEGWRQFGTDKTRLLAVGLAMWMDRKTQSIPDDPNFKPGSNDHRLCVIMRATTFTDPFEDFQEEFTEPERNGATQKCQKPKHLFQGKWG